MEVHRLRENQQGLELSTTEPAPCNPSPRIPVRARFTHLHIVSRIRLGVGDAETTAVFFEGGIYHVYNRVTQGEMVFADTQEAAPLLDVMRDAKERDGLKVLAWCVLGNHRIFNAIRAVGPDYST